MTDVTIYHNPNCSKSRQTLELLRERGIEPLVIEYLEEPLDAATLSVILGKLGIEAFDLIRNSEDEFEKLGLADRRDDRDALVQAMVEHPIIIQRPIVVVGECARLGRPPELVTEILE